MFGGRILNAFGTRKRRHRKSEQRQVQSEETPILSDARMQLPELPTVDRVPVINLPEPRSIGRVRFPVSETARLIANRLIENTAPAIETPTIDGTLVNPAPCDIYDTALIPEFGKREGTLVLPTLEPNISHTPVFHRGIWVDASFCEPTIYEDNIEQIYGGTVHPSWCEYPIETIPVYLRGIDVSHIYCDTLPTATIPRPQLMDGTPVAPLRLPGVIEQPPVKIEGEDVDPSYCELPPPAPVYHQGITTPPVQCDTLPTRRLSLPGLLTGTPVTPSLPIKP